jgi:hypothetical protein
LECHAAVDKRAKRVQGEIYQKGGLGDPTEGKTVVNGDCSVALVESRHRMSLPSPGTLLLHTDDDDCYPPVKKEHRQAIGRKEVARRKKKTGEARDLVDIN